MVEGERDAYGRKIKRKYAFEYVGALASIYRLIFFICAIGGEMEAKLVNKYRETREQLSAACAPFREMENGIGWAIRIDATLKRRQKETHSLTQWHSIEQRTITTTNNKCNMHAGERLAY